MNRLAAYNFLAKKLGLVEFSSEEELFSTIQNNTADKRCIPSFWFCVYDINSKQKIADLFTARNRFEIVKVANGVVTEFYRNFINQPIYYRSYDLVDTEKETEYYSMDGVRLVKYDSNTHQELGYTTDVAAEKMPEDFEAKLSNFQYKDNILYWANKPYGQIVGVMYPIP